MTLCPFSNQRKKQVLKTHAPPPLRAALEVHRCAKEGADCQHARARAGTLLLDLAEASAAWQERKLGRVSATLAQLPWAL